MAACENALPRNVGPAETLSRTLNLEDFAATPAPNGPPNLQCEPSPQPKGRVGMGKCVVILFLGLFLNCIYILKLNKKFIKESFCSLLPLLSVTLTLLLLVSATLALALCYL